VLINTCLLIENLSNSANKLNILLFYIYIIFFAAKGPSCYSLKIAKGAFACRPQYCVRQPLIDDEKIAEVIEIKSKLISIIEFN